MMYNSVYCIIKFIQIYKDFSKKFPPKNLTCIIIIIMNKSFHIYLYLALYIQYNLFKQMYKIFQSLSRFTFHRLQSTPTILQIKQLFTSKNHIPDHDQAIHKYLFNSSLFFKQKQFIKAKTQNLKIIEQSNKEGNNIPQRTLMLAYSNISNCCRALNQLDQCLRYLQKFIELSKKPSNHSNPNQMIYSGTGQILYVNINQFKEIDEQLIQIIDYLKQNQIPQQKYFFAYKFLAITFMNSNFKASIQYFQKCLQLMSTGKLLNHPVFEADIYKDLIQVCRRAKQWKLYLKYMQQSIPSNIKIHGQISVLVARIYIKMSLRHIQLQQIDKALQRKLKAVEILLKLPQDSQIGYVYFNIGMLFTKKKLYEKSIQFFSKSLENLKRTDPKDKFIGQSYHRLGRSNLEIGKIGVALENFEKQLNQQIIRYGKEHEITKECQDYIKKCQKLLQNVK